MRARKLRKRVEHTLRQLWNRERRHPTGNHPIGVMLLSPIIEDPGFGDHREDAMTRLRDEVSPLLALAEAAATRQEVMDTILPLAEEAFRAAVRDNLHVAQARANVHVKLIRYLDAHYFVFDGFGRKRTVDKIIKRLFKGYQKNYRRVEQEAKRLFARAQRENKYNYSAKKATRDAVRVVWPKIFEDVDDDEFDYKSDW